MPTSYIGNIPLDYSSSLPPLYYNENIDVFIANYNPEADINYGGLYPFIVNSSGINSYNINADSPDPSLQWSFFANCSNMTVEPTPEQTFTLHNIYAIASIGGAFNARPVASEFDRNFYHNGMIGAHSCTIENVNFGTIIGAYNCSLQGGTGLSGPGGLPWGNANGVPYNTVIGTSDSGIAAQDFGFIANSLGCFIARNHWSAIINSTGCACDTVGDYNTILGCNGVVLQNGVGNGGALNAYLSKITRSGGTIIGGGYHTSSVENTNISVPFVTQKTPVTTYVNGYSPEATFTSAEIDFKVRSTHTVTLPANSVFIPFEVGIIATSITALTTQPSMSFGKTGNNSLHLAETQPTKLTQLYNMDTYVLTNRTGSTSLTATITSPATGSDVKGKFFWRGLFLEV